MRIRVKSRRAFSRADKDAQAQQIKTWMESHPGVFRS